MPVTIGTLTSRITVLEGDVPLSPELLERLVNAVLARLRQELAAEEARRLEQEVPQRFSNPDPWGGR